MRLFAPNGDNEILRRWTSDEWSAQLSKTMGKRWSAHKIKEAARESTQNLERLGRRGSSGTRDVSAQSKLVNFNETEIEAFSIQLHGTHKHSCSQPQRNTTIYVYFHLKIITMKHNIGAHVLRVLYSHIKTKCATHTTDRANAVTHIIIYSL